MRRAFTNGYLTDHLQPQQNRPGTNHLKRTAAQVLSRDSFREWKKPKWGSFTLDPWERCAMFNFNFFLTPSVFAVPSILSRGDLKEHPMVRQFPLLLFLGLQSSYFSSTQSSKLLRQFMMTDGLMALFRFRFQGCQQKQTPSRLNHFHSHQLSAHSHLTMTFYKAFMRLTTRVARHAPQWSCFVNDPETDTVEATN